MPRLLSTSVCALIALSLFSGLAIALGSTSLPKTIAGFEGCTFPCWYGVSLADMYSDRQRMMDNMIAAGYQEQSNFSDTSHFFTATGQCDVAVNIDPLQQTLYLIIGNCPDLRLGDLLRQIGAPAGVSIYGGSVLIYRYGEVIASMGTGSWFTWITPVDTISMMSGGQMRGAGMFNWQGVAPRGFYCQSQAELVTLIC